MVVEALGLECAQGGFSIFVWGGESCWGWGLFWMLVLELAGQQFARDSIIW